MVRDAESSDARRIGEITVAGWQNAYVGIVPDDVLERQKIDPHIDYFTSDDAFAPGMRTMVVESDGIVVGYAHLGPVRSEPDEQIEGLELWGMYIDPDYQGQGIGRSLMNAVLDHFRSVDCSSVYLWVMRDNVTARRFDESGGWRLDTSVSRPVPVPQVRYRLTP